MLNEFTATGNHASDYFVSCGNAANAQGIWVTSECPYGTNPTPAETPYSIVLTQLQALTPTEALTSHVTLLLQFDTGFAAAFKVSPKPDPNAHRHIHGSGVRVVLACTFSWQPPCAILPSSTQPRKTAGRPQRRRHRRTSAMISAPAVLR